jgi:hypothetical protein
MKRVIGIRKADRIEAGESVLVPQNGMGVLLAHEVTGTEPVDAGRYAAPHPLSRCRKGG